MFIKIRYERSNSDAQIFSLEQFKKDKKSYDAYKSKDAPDFYQLLFEQTKKDFAKDNLFEDNEIINIRENSFEQIVKELQIYNLSTTSDDVKGIAFEQFLGRTFRGELGQFFTPRTIVDFMVTVLDPQEGEYLCDPFCGSGGFLIRAFEYVRTSIEKDIEDRKEVWMSHLQMSFLYLERGPACADNINPAGQGRQGQGCKAFISKIRTETLWS